MTVQRLSDLVLLPIPAGVENADGHLLAPDEIIPAEVAPSDPLPNEGYRLHITPEGVRIEASGPAGAFYARMTLRQIARCCDGPWPCGVIEDYPRFPTRGVMLDISRDKVPKLDTLRSLIDQFAEWKINRLELYTEHTFAYRDHATVWQNADPMTPEDIRTLDAYCRERFIALAPNQNSFGHFERWLKHDAYKDLAECPKGFDYPWGGRSPCGTTLNPRDPATVQLLDSLYAELLPNFTSRNFNVGCDETWELGKGRSAEACNQQGKGRVYLDFLMKIYRLTQQYGFRMHFWGDVILHHPELIPELPVDITALAWGYEADHPFEKDSRAFAASGIPFIVCPGTSSWNSIGGRTANCIVNLQRAATNAEACGAEGLLITDWGDRGHWQYLPVSLLGFALGAALAWQPGTNTHLCDDHQRLHRHIGTHAFLDAHGRLAEEFMALGCVHEPISKGTTNGHVLFRTFNQHALHGDGWDKVLADLGAEHFLTVRAALEALPSAPDVNGCRRDDRRLLQSEFTQAKRMLSHGCERALMSLGHPEARTKADMAADLQDIIEQHQRLWLARNRPGGLNDSLAYMRRCMPDYTA